MNGKKKDYSHYSQKYIIIIIICMYENKLILYYLEKEILPLVCKWQNDHSKREENASLTQIGMDCTKAPRVRKL